jgi:hypothetical protein
MESPQTYFFSKENIRIINRKILEELNLSSVNNKDNQIIINRIQQNMKQMWQKIDINRINNSNINKILDQFNTAIIRNIAIELSRSMKNTDDFSKESSTLPIKFAVQQNPIAYPERPKNMNHGLTNYQGLAGIDNHLDQSLDTLFRPLIEDPDQEARFNNYQDKSAGNDYKERLMQIQQNRSLEVPLPPNRSNARELPDRLKPRATSVRPQEEQEQGNFNNFNNNNFNNNNFNHHNQNQNNNYNNQNNNFMDNNNDDNLYDINNIDNSLIPEDIIEDNRSFEERLNSLKNDRNNINVQQNPNNSIESFEPTPINNILRRPVKHDIDHNQNQNLTILMEEIIKCRKELSICKEEINKQKIINFSEDKQTHTVSKTQKNNYIEIINKYKKMNEELMDTIKDLKNELGSLNKINEVKEEIENEFNKLKELKTLNEIKLGEIKLREMELMKKEKIKNIQFEISSDESNYTYNFPVKINEINCIKLLNYSVPQKKFNIEENINNIFKYKILDEEKEIIIKTGYYDINKLLDNLNLNEDNLIFEFNNFNQTITIKCENNIQILNTNLSYNNLGFINFSDETNTLYEADRIYDLRIDEKIYLYLLNIDEINPFAILNINSKKEFEIQFDENKSLEFINLVFKDQNGFEINFYDIKHYLNFEIYCI